jgi:phage terminase small subunit
MAGNRNAQSLQAMEQEMTRGTKNKKADALALSPRHAAFVHEYLMTYSATKAAIAAGYSKRSAAQIGHVLLRKHEIAAEITARRYAQAEALEGIANERIEFEVAALAMGNMADMSPMFGEGDVAEKLRNLTRTQAACVKEITVEEFRDGRSDWRTVRRTKFKLADKTPSLRLLAEMRGLVVDKVDVKHTHTGTILHAMLREIAEEEAGKPIVDVEPVQIEDKGEAA